jgi:hypothetical protein
VRPDASGIPRPSKTLILMGVGAGKEKFKMCECEIVNHFKVHRTREKINVMQKTDARHNSYLSSANADRIVHSRDAKTRLKHLNSETL